MRVSAERRAFMAFHATLGLVLLYGSLRTAVGAMSSGHHELPLVLLASGESLGALLFLIPRTLRIGAALLLLTIGLAIVVHALGGQLRADPLVYASGVIYVLVHGAAWGPLSRQTS